MRTFKLTDDCTLSGVRLLPDDRRIDGGGYFYPDFPGRLVPAHGVVEVPVGGMKPGEKEVRFGRKFARGEHFLKHSRSRNSAQELSIRSRKERP